MTSTPFLPTTVQIFGRPVQTKNGNYAPNNSILKTLWRCNTVYVSLLLPISSSKQIAWVSIYMLIPYSFTFIFSAPLDTLTQWSNGCQWRTWELFCRFIPLKFVDITVHSAKDRRFKLKLVSGRSFYLQLCAPRQKQSSIFYQWFRIINLLKSTNSEINFLPRDFDTRTKNRGIRNRSSKMNADQVNATPLHKII